MRFQCENKKSLYSFMVCNSCQQYLINRSMMYFDNFPGKYEPLGIQTIQEEPKLISTKM